MAIDDVSRAVHCGDCDALLSSEEHACPECGSRAQHVKVRVHETITIREGIRLKTNEPGRKKPIKDYQDKPEFFRKAGRWHRVLRIFDRSVQPARYYEHITDEESGDVIRHVDEPLSDHRGRGDARSLSSTDQGL